jgi:hypothetical protein
VLGFSGSVLLVGGLLLGASALSGWLRGTVLSVSVLPVAAGIGLSVTGVLDIAPDEPWLSEVIEVALILTLFADGLTAERVLVRRSWHDPLRALLLAMPLTLVAIASREGAVRRVELGRGAAAGRRVGADRSCGHVDGGHERACPGGGPKHTEPRVGAQ